ncbi:ATP-binding protein [Streptomyces sp. NPDC055078]
MSSTMRTAVIYTCRPDPAAAMAELGELAQAAEERGYAVRAAVSDTAASGVPLGDRQGWRFVDRLIRDGGPQVLVMPSTAELERDAADRSAVLERLAERRVRVEAVRPASWEVSQWRRIWCRCDPPGGGAKHAAGRVRSCRAVFPAHPAHARAARRMVEDALRAWGADGLRQDRDLVVLAAHELITNAISHGSRAGDPVEVTIERDQRRLRVGVEDRSPAPPRPRSAGDGDDSGRGLALVADIADRWGTIPRPDGTGKQVWMLFRARRPRVAVAA